MDKVLLTPLKIIDAKGGRVFHGIKKNSQGYTEFGEAYFSEIRHNEIKAWKRHKRMTMNLMVPVGEVKFVIYDDRSLKNKIFQEVILSPSNYQRLTIPPMIWFGFKGVAKKDSVILNIADILHESTEAENKNIEELNFNWSKK